jgi:hypothetical protein
VTTGPTEPTYGRAWWAGLAVGGSVLAWGLVGLVGQAMATVPPAWAGWLLACLLVHDLVVVPAVFAVARLVGRAPARWRPAMRAALVVSGVLVLVTAPALLGGGRSTQPGNSSVLPGDYPRSLALVLGLVWAVAAGWVLAGSLRRSGERFRGRAGERAR